MLRGKKSPIKNGSTDRSKNVQRRFKLIDPTHPSAPLGRNQ
jgi:hypothetical protein